MAEATSTPLTRPIILGDLTLASPTTTLTIGAGGAASAVTANPAGYLIVMLGNTDYLIPYYNNGNNSTPGSTVLLSDGSAAVPSLAFQSALDVGFFRADSPGPLSVAAAGWNTGTDTISATAHGFQSYIEVQLTTTGVLPTGLSLATGYFTIAVDANTLALATTLGNAFIGAKVNFTTQGTGTHTITATYPSSLGIASGGIQKIKVTPRTTYIGGSAGITQEAQEIVHMENNLSGTSYPNSADCVIMNLGNGSARYITTTDNLLATYIECHGSGPGGSWWSGGPTVANSADCTFESASAGVLFKNLLCSKDTYFWNDGTHGNWSFNYGAAGTQIFKIEDTGVLSKVNQSFGAGVGLVGTATNDAAAAGNVGEYVTAAIAVGSAIAAGTTTQYKTITSISLTAGDWIVSGQVSTILSAATATAAMAAISLFANNTVTDQVDGVNQLAGGPPTANYNNTITISNYRISLASTTTVYLKCAQTFAVGTPTMFGSINAVRAR